METGKVKFFDEEKGFGFIEKENETDVFVHYSQVDGGVINDGDQVEFAIEKTDRGFQAINVKKV